MLKTYYFIGIKGAGMSALALLLHQMGKTVKGSDHTKYYFTQHELEKANITILPFDERNIESSYEIIVGNAFREDNNIEVAFLCRNGFSFKRYHEFLGEFMKQFISIGVTGAHGKTSTTGMLSHILSQIEDTSFLIGDGTGQGLESAKYFVFESDEYERHFMPYHPEYSIFTNVDFDHPDYFHDIDDVFLAFQDYANQVSKGIFAYGEDKYLRKLQVAVPIYYYGVNEDDDYQARNIVRMSTGSIFDVYYKDEEIGNFTVPTFGHHNVMNALAVIGVLHQLGLSMKQVSELMPNFCGVKRRFSEKIIDDIIIIDDFAHHPTEIEATLDAARQKHPDREIIAVFQPHTFTRTIALLDDFARVLDRADSVYLAEIYRAAREGENQNVNIRDLAAKIERPVSIILEDDVSPLLNHSKAVYVFMGAGDIQKYEYAFEELLGQHIKNVN